jgi:prephenate dehydrogenase
MGASIGVGLTRLGVEVTLEDTSPLAQSVAIALGVGRLRNADDAAPHLVVVATPPEVAGPVAATQLNRFPGAVVTDVASVKAAVLGDVRGAGADLSRYVGSHPMAGRERGGAAAAMADLFAGRPWVITDSGQSDPSALGAVRDLAVDLGATPVPMDPDRHDAAVALVSHLPQMVASMVAARLVEAPPGAVDLAGSGLRDVTRIAASDPMLWAAILAGNAGQVADLLTAVRADIDQALEALQAAAGGDLGRGVAGLHGLIARGNAGVSRVPGKHGAARNDWDQVTVMVPDRPGELARLFAEIGKAGVNLEDVDIEHAGGKPVGLTSISVLRGAGPSLAEDLARAGWRILA